MSASALATRGLFAPHLLVVATPQVVAGPCKRPVATLLLSTNGRPFQLAMPGVNRIEATAVLVAPKQLRALRAEQCDLLSLNVEPGHPHYNALRHRLGGDAAIIFGARHFSGARDQLTGFFEGGWSAHEAASSVDALLEAASGVLLKTVRRDARIADVLSCVHATLPERPPIGKLARMVGLSEDRLSHLFTETVGMPLRSYVVWQRYRLAIRQLSPSEGLTTLANRCGFSDAAHMTRTFVEFFGFTPSLLLRSGFVQDLSPCE